MLHEILAPGVHARYKQHEKLRVEKGHAGMPWFADADHWPGSKGPSPGPKMPCELSHESVIAHHMKRPCTIWEVLASHGWHMWPSTSWPTTPKRSVLEHFNNTQLKNFGGMGMHLPTVWAVFLYALTHIVWKTDVVVPVREMSWKSGGTSFFETFEDEDEESEKAGTADQGAAESQQSRE